MFNGRLNRLKPSRRAFYYAYRAIRLERRYAHQCIEIAIKYAGTDPAIFLAEPELLRIDIGHRTKENCELELYRAVLGAMLYAKLPGPLPASQRIEIKRRHKIY